MATIQQYRIKGNGSVGLIETIYTIIKSRSGKVTSKDLDMLVGNKQDVRFAITRLTVQGRIKRIRGFGKVGIEYFYEDIASNPPKPKQHSIGEQTITGASWY